MIVVDGGSQDATVRHARKSGASVMTSQRGRGCQMNAGAARARADTILFLHADSRLPDGWEAMMDEAMSSGGGSRPLQWGCFESISIDVRTVIRLNCIHIIH